MSGTVAAPSSDDLGTEQIHDVLRNGRRRLVLDILHDVGGPVSVRELAERIGTIESGEEPPPRNVRQSVYVSLLQTHLPKLDGLDIVDYEAQGRQVRVGEGLEEVAVYLETVQPYGLAWAEYYALVSLLGALTVVAAALGTPGVSGLSPAAWAVGFLGLVFVSGVYHAVRQGSSMLHRHLG